MTQPFTSNQLSIDDRQLEQRRQTAWAIAHQCEQILREEFGATEVIVFGSLAGQSPWHWDSDLDIAVAGLSDQSWLQSYGRLEALMTNWLKIDLIRLENVNFRVRARILNRFPMSENKYSTLKRHLDDELLVLEQSADDLDKAVERAKPVLDNYDIRAVASYINDFYRRCERMSERVAVTLDGGLLQGVNWHQALLRQVAETGKEGRPPLWAGALILDLDEYRKFRHVIHHKYGDKLKPDYVIPLAEMAPAILSQVKGAIATFSHWLAQQATQADSEGDVP